MNIGRSINVALAKRDMKRADLMRSFGWSPAYVSKICKSSEIGMGSVQKLSEFFDMQVSEFIALGEDK
jgi:DNA-binding Xre family transcriptional regulator